MSNDEYQQQQYWKNIDYEWINLSPKEWEEFNLKNDIEIFPPREKSFESNQKIKKLTLDEIIQRYPLTEQEVYNLKNKK